MLHRIGSMCFIIAILIYLLQYIKPLKKYKKEIIKWHITLGVISIVFIITYSVLDFFKTYEWTILLLAVSMVLIYISGLKNIRSKFKKLHLISALSFFVALAIHIIF